MHADLIHDVGMNNGDDTAYYLFKGYRVVAIEANPVLADAARRRFADAIADGRLTLLHCGIGPQPGSATFWVCDENSAWSSFDPKAACRAGRSHPVEVPCRTFDSVLREHGVPLYLKVDIEGYDELCVQAIDPADRPQYVSIEITGLSSLVALQARGYNAFKCISQRTHRQVRYDPRASAEAESPSSMDWEYRPDATGRRAWMRAPGPDGWSFPFGSTGPFGETTDGVWQTAEDAAFAYLARRLGYATPGAGGPNDWYDLHATCLDIPPVVRAADPAARVCRIMDSVGKTLGRPARMWLFGAGRHTNRLLEKRQSWESAGHRVVGLIDDDPALTGVGLLGLPVWPRVRFESAVAGGEVAPDAVILSSDTFEDHFWQITAAIRDHGVPVYRLYAPGESE
ncbi:MAG: FkbM family methyltransferase [Phycisphaerae bacterium]|nr:FkbM family methyltransferase [Phycisphaerae bacterium]